MKQARTAGWEAIRQSNQDNDSPWKDILEGYFREFIAFFFPWIENDVDWDKGYKLLNKEFDALPLIL